MQNCVHGKLVHKVIAVVGMAHHRISSLPEDEDGAGGGNPSNYTPQPCRVLSPKLTFVLISWATGHTSKQSIGLQHPPTPAPNFSRVDNANIFLGSGTSILSLA